MTASRAPWWCRRFHDWRSDGGGYQRDTCRRCFDVDPPSPYVTGAAVRRPRRFDAIEYVGLTLAAFLAALSALGFIMDLVTA